MSKVTGKKGERTRKSGGNHAHLRGGPKTGGEGQESGSLHRLAGGSDSGDERQDTTYTRQDTGNERDVIESPDALERDLDRKLSRLSPDQILNITDISPENTPTDQVIALEQQERIERGDIPLAPEAVEITDYKGTSLKDIGRGADGRVIPHKRSEGVAKRVLAWRMGGYEKNDIAIFLNIRPGLVESCYGKELRHGKEMMGMTVTEHIIKRSKKSDRMAIFLAKSQMGWRDGDTKPVDTSLLNLHIHM